MPKSVACLALEQEFERLARKRLCIPDDAFVRVRITVSSGGRLRSPPARPDLRYVVTRDDMLRIRRTIGRCREKYVHVHLRELIDGGTTRFPAGRGSWVSVIDRHLREMGLPFCVRAVDQWGIDFPKKVYRIYKALP